jgi:hypothetical protein
MDFYSLRLDEDSHSMDLAFILNGLDEMRASYSMDFGMNFNYQLLTV